jgi:hypothetical protein
LHSKIGADDVSFDDVDIIVEFETTTFDIDENSTIIASTKNVDEPNDCGDLQLSMGIVRSDLKLCCKYPELVMPLEIDEQCQAECKIKFSEFTNCCYLVCVLREVGFLRFSTDPNMMPIPDVQGVIKSYMYSVEDDPTWEPVIKSSASRCFEDSHGIDNEYDCSVVPKSLQYMVQCSFIENFLKCPVWNPKKINECAAAYKYVSECYSVRDTVMGV